MLTEASTTPFCPSSASFDGVSCAWPRVSGRPCVRCELSEYVCVVDSGTARGCVLSLTHPRAVDLANSSNSGPRDLRMRSSDGESSSDSSGGVPAS